MGGKAIKIAERVDREKFFKYSKEIIPRVAKAFGTEVSMVDGYHNKESFGDLDLLVLVNKDFGIRESIIEKEFSPQEIFKNSHIISFNYNELQVDLIFTTEKNWETSKVFFQWGDLGNFMGKLYNNYGNLSDNGFILKYGFDGLKCNINYKGVKRTVNISKDSKHIFDFIGLDFQQFKKGFDDREQMFDYVISSDYFCYNSYQWVNQNSINKNRNKRRPNYIEFLDYIEQYKDRTITWNPDCVYYLDILHKEFGVDLLKHKEDLITELDIKADIHKKFNGELIMENYPGLSGKELGLAINRFKQSKSDYDQYILETSQKNIIEEFGNYI